MVRKYRIKEGGSMLPVKKEKVTVNDSHSTAKKADVLKAIIKSNKKHAKMMSMLAR